MKEVAMADNAAPVVEGRQRMKTTPAQVLAIVCVGIILAQIDLFIVNVALPSIAHDLGSQHLEDLSWVLNGYAIAYASLLVFFGRLAERYPRNITFLLGVGSFTVASAACAAATSVEMLVIFRILQAAGAALMTPTSLGLLLATFPPQERASAVRTWTAVGGFAAALGPLVGGMLVAVSWRWIFLVNVPIGLAAILVGWKMLPHLEGHEAPPPSLWGAALITGGVASLTFAIVKVNDWGWRSPDILATVGFAVVCVALFVRHCLRSPNPFVEPALFRIRRFTGAAASMTIFSAAFGLMLLSIVLWEQSIWHWSAMKIGFAIAPGPLLVPAMSLLFAKRLIARFGAPAVVAVGMTVFSCGLIVWALVLASEPNLVGAICGMILIGSGVGLTLPTLMGVAMASLPPSAFATGSGVLNMFRQSGIAIGVAALVAIIGSTGAHASHAFPFYLGWWLTAAVVLLSVFPTLALMRQSTPA